MSSLRPRACLAPEGKEVKYSAVQEKGFGVPFFDRCPSDFKNFLPRESSSRGQVRRCAGKGFGVPSSESVDPQTLKHVSSRDSDRHPPGHPVVPQTSGTFCPHESKEIKHAAVQVKVLSSIVVPQTLSTSCPVMKERR